MASFAQRLGSFPVVVTRLAGLWILAGAFFKLFLGTPADLPLVIQDLPPDLPLTFRVVIAAELTVGLLALLRPRWAWLLVMALLVLFGLVLVTQIRDDAASCGCFGSTLEIPPTFMLVVDASILLLLLVSRPWRSLGRDDVSLAILVLVLAVAIPMPWILDREARGSDDTDPLIGEAYSWFDPESWVGKPLAETKLGKVLELDEQQLASDGLWILWRLSCEHCADLFLDLPTYEYGERPLVLVLVPEPDLSPEEKRVHETPTGEHVVSVALPNRDWTVMTPVGMVVEGGCVVWVKMDMGVEDHASSLDPPVPASCAKE